MPMLAKNLSSSTEDKIHSKSIELTRNVGDEAYCPPQFGQFRTCMQDMET
jgi:hypothetical protein